MARRNQAALPPPELGLTLEDLFAETLELRTTYNGKPLDIVWAPLRYTPAVEERIDSLAGQDDDDEDEGETGDGDDIAKARVQADQDAAIRELLAEVLVSWSLTDGTGVTVGTDRETLKRLPRPFLQHVFSELGGAAGPKDQSEPASEASSS